MAPAEHTQLHESPYDAEMAQIAQQRWGDYMKNIKPVENEYMGNVEWYKTPNAKNEASTMATSDVYKQGQQASGQMNTSMADAGINPSSGASIMKRAGLATSLAGTAGSADTKAQMGSQDEYLKGLENVVAMGNNQAGTAQGGLSQVASNALSQAETNAEYDKTASMAPGQAVGTAVGLGLGSVNRYNHA